MENVYSVIEHKKNAHELNIKVCEEEIIKLSQGMIETKTERK